MNLTRLTKNPAIAGARADVQQSEPASLSSTFGDNVIFVDESGVHVWIRLIPDSRC